MLRHSEIISLDESYSSNSNKKGGNEILLNYERLLESEEYSDFKIVVKFEETHKQILPVHKFVLQVQCPYFKTMFHNSPGIEELEIKDYRVKVVTAAIKYMYSGTTSGISSFAAELLRLADMWLINGLKTKAEKKCLDIIQHCRANQYVYVVTLVDILGAAHLCKAKEVEIATLDYIHSIYDKIEDSDVWISFTKDTRFTQIFIDYFDRNSPPKKRSKLNT